MKRFAIACITAALAAQPVTALEMTAVDQVRDSNIGLQMRLEAVQAAVQAAFNNFLASNKACAAKSMLWNPEVADADSDGCIDLASTKCFKAGKDFDPSDGDADAGGCIPKPVAVPADSVVAFNSTSCPSGWAALTAAQNRVIVGTGSSYARGATGGADTRAIARANLPNSSLNVYFSKWVYSDDAAGSGKVLMANRNVGSSGANGGLGISAYSRTEALGSGQAFDVRQPYLALLYCYKL